MKANKHTIPRVYSLLAIVELPFHHCRKLWSLGWGSRSCQLGQRRRLSGIIAARYCDCSVNPLRPRIVFTSPDTSRTRYSCTNLIAIRLFTLKNRMSHDYVSVLESASFNVVMRKEPVEWLLIFSCTKNISYWNKVSIANYFHIWTQYNFIIGRPVTSRGISIIKKTINLREAVWYFFVT